MAVIAEAVLQGEWFILASERWLTGKSASEAGCLPCSIPAASILNRPRLANAVYLGAA